MWTLLIVLMVAHGPTQKESVVFKSKPMTEAVCLTQKHKFEAAGTRGKASCVKAERKVSWVLDHSDRQWLSSP